MNWDTAFFIFQGSISLHSVSTGIHSYQWELGKCWVVQLPLMKNGNTEEQEKCGCVCGWWWWGCATVFRHSKKEGHMLYFRSVSVSGHQTSVCPLIRGCLHTPFIKPPQPSIPSIPSWKHQRQRGWTAEWGLVVPPESDQYSGVMEPFFKVHF